jgi:hypothetical protein
MRNGTATILGSILLLLTDCKGFPSQLPSSQEYFVLASSLRVRQRPDTTAPVFNVLPYGSRILGREVGVPETIEGQHGSWIALRSGGFAFGGLLTRNPVPYDERKGLYVMRQAGTVFCMSDTSRFSEEILFLSAGRVRYGFRDYSRCTFPNIRVEANGSYEITETGVDVQISQGLLNTTFDACGMEHQPPKVSLSSPRKLQLIWSSYWSAFLTPEIAAQMENHDMKLNPRLCILQPKAQSIAAGPYDMCSEEIHEYEILGPFCPGQRPSF